MKEKEGLVLIKILTLGWGSSAEGWAKMAAIKTMWMRAVRRQQRKQSLMGTGIMQNMEKRMNMLYQTIMSP